MTASSDTLVTADGAGMIDTQQPIVFYHSADLDGKASAAIVAYHERKLHGHEVEFYGINYGDVFPWEKAEGRVVYMVDFSLQPYEGMLKLAAVAKELHWLDHHESVLKDIEKCGYPKCFHAIEVGKAGCEIAWEYFNQDGNPPVPEAVRLLGRYDVWCEDYEPDYEVVVPITGWEGLYSVSSSGAIYSEARPYRNQNGATEVMQPRRLLRPSLNGAGYLQVTLKRGEEQQAKPIHAAVAAAFLIRPPGAMEVNHINRHKLDNRLANLEWCTHRQNMEHSASGEFHGVDLSQGRYRARVSIRGERYYRGCFATAEEAAQAYDEFVVDNDMQAELPMNFAQGTCKPPRRPVFWQTLVLPFQYGMRMQHTEPTSELWPQLFGFAGAEVEDDWLRAISAAGDTVLKYEAKQNEVCMSACAFEGKFGGYRALIANRGPTNSKLFDSKWDPEKHDIMVAFYWSRKGFWSCHLYTAKAGVDCAALAKQHGGGGHVRAAGFQCQTLPFELGVTP